MIEAVALGVAVLTLSGYGYLADFERYSVFCVGVERRVSRAHVEGEYECIDCEEETSEAERVRWYRELVLFGAPLHQLVDGDHYYCEDHASADYHLHDIPTVDETPWYWAFLEALFEPSTSIEEDSEFQNVTTSVGAAFHLIPVALLVLIAAMIIGLVGRASQ